MKHTCYFWRKRGMAQALCVYRLSRVQCRTHKTWGLGLAAASGCKKLSACRYQQDDTKSVLI